MKMKLMILTILLDGCRYRRFSLELQYGLAITKKMENIEDAVSRVCGRLTLMNIDPKSFGQMTQ